MVCIAATPRGWPGRPTLGATEYIATTHLPGPASRGPRTLSGLVPDSLPHAGMAILRGHHPATVVPTESAGLVCRNRPGGGGPARVPGSERVSGAVWP